VPTRLCHLPPNTIVTSQRCVCRVKCLLQPLRHLSIHSFNKIIFCSSVPRLSTNILSRVCDRKKPQSIFLNICSTPWYHPSRRTGQVSVGCWFYQVRGRRKKKRKGRKEATQNTRSTTFLFVWTCSQCRDALYCLYHHHHRTQWVAIISVASIATDRHSGTHRSKMPFFVAM
jgi:hypothetical protein